MSGDQPVRSNRIILRGFLDYEMSSDRLVEVVNRFHTLEGEEGVSNLKRATDRRFFYQTSEGLYRAALTFSDEEAPVVTRQALTSLREVTSRVTGVNFTNRSALVMPQGTQRWWECNYIELDEVARDELAETGCVTDDRIVIKNGCIDEMTVNTPRGKERKRLMFALELRPYS